MVIFLCIASGADYETLCCLTVCQVLVLANNISFISASEVTTLWRYTNLFVISIIIISVVECCVCWTFNYTQC